MAERSTSPGKTIAALGFLGLASFAFYTLVLDGGASVPEDSAEIVTPEPMGADAGAADPGAESTARGGRKATVIRADLLRQHGVLPATVQVGSPFRAPQAVEARVGRAGDGEFAGEQWEPPALNVTLIFHAGDVRRASVDGAVVGVADSLAGGTVTRIERDGIELRLRGTLLFYELQSPYPRGYEPPTESDETASQPDAGNVGTEAGAHPRSGKKS